MMRCPKCYLRNKPSRNGVYYCRACAYTYRIRTDKEPNTSRISTMRTLGLAVSATLLSIAGIVVFATNAYGATPSVSSYAQLFSDRAAQITQSYNQLGAGVQTSLNNFASQEGKLTTQMTNLSKMPSIGQMPTLPSLPQLPALQMSMPSMPSLPSLPSLPNWQVPTLSATVSPVTEAGFIQAFGTLPSFSIPQMPSYSTIMVNPNSTLANMLSSQGCSSAQSCYLAMTNANANSVNAQFASGASNLQTSFYNAYSMAANNNQSLYNKAIIPSKNSYKNQAKMLSKLPMVTSGSGKSLLKDAGQALTGTDPGVNHFLQKIIGIPKGPPLPTLPDIGHFLSKWASDINPFKGL